MTGDLLPVFMVTEFDKYEITNRMECLVNYESEACMDYCSSL